MRIITYVDSLLLVNNKRVSKGCQRTYMRMCRSSCILWWYLEIYWNYLVILVVQHMICLGLGTQFHWIIPCNDFFGWYLQAQSYTIFLACQDIDFSFCFHECNLQLIYNNLFSWSNEHSSIKRLSSHAISIFQKHHLSLLWLLRVKRSDHISPIYLTWALVVWHLYLSGRC